jgi:mevalonate kinase
MAILSFLFLYLNIVGPIRYALGEAARADTSSADITVTSQLPIGAGLGSSAAFCVCAAAACLLATGSVSVEEGAFPEAAQTLINSWAFEAEKLIHGNPSGIDNCISTFGIDLP